MQYTVEIRSPSGNRTVMAEEGRSLLSILRETDFPISSPCGGRGTCGKCRVICDGSLSPVTAEEKKKQNAKIKTDKKKTLPDKTQRFSSVKAVKKGK